MKSGTGVMIAQSDRNNAQGPLNDMASQHLTLIERFEELKDPRVNRTKRHLLSVLKS